MDSRVEVNGVAGSGAWLPHRLGGFVLTEGLPLLGRPAQRAHPDYLPSLPLAWILANPSQRSVAVRLSTATASPHGFDSLLIGRNHS